MGEFRRSYSKVWWANYFQNKETSDAVASVPCTGGRPSANVDVNRNLSSSPSNGSHRSQDSGFSDSESSSPTHCPASKNSRPSARALTQRVEKFSTRTYPGIRELSANGIIPRAQLRKQKKQTKNAHIVEETNETTASPLNLVDDYLANCCHQMTKYNKIDRTSHPGRRWSADLCPPEDQTKISTGSESRSRSCFIVDEIPKKFPNGSELAEESTETCTSTSSYNETVRFIEKKNVAIENEKSRSLNSSLIAPTTPQKSNESKSSTLDLSGLPAEPPFTSTPKKCEVKMRKVEKKLKPSTPTILDDAKCGLVDPPVIVWLLELQRRYETECMTMLQSKTIARCYNKQTSNSVVLSQSLNSVQIFQERTKLIASDFLKLYEKLNSGLLVFVRSRAVALTNSIKELIVNDSQLLPRMESSVKDNVLQLMDLCDYLKKIVESSDQSNLAKDIDLLEKLFYRFVDSVLVQQIIHLFSALEKPNSETTLLNALYGISNLNLSTSFALDLIGHLNGVERLLAISYESSSGTVRKSALRALTVVCQNDCNIQQWEKARGIDVISEMLSDMTKDESELSEIISVLVQITALWVENDHIITGLSYHLYTILNALTRIISTSNSSETLLLCAAATANISFIETRATKMLLNLNTATSLLTAVRKLGVKASIFLQEQVATLIANMASELAARQQFAANRAVGALLCFLQVKHSALLTDAEMVAAERLQHKSAVALSRLCSNREISKQVVELHGVERLVRLCKEKKERNYNDGVLVACLSTLRKITSICGRDVVEDLNAGELVEPRLVDSYLLYSSRQESYV